MTEQNLLTEEIPEKFKNPETGELQIDLLLKSYQELERKLSSPDLKAVQIPKRPEDYPINCSHGFFEPDIEINKRLHEKGFSPDQAQVVYDLAAERMIPMLHEVIAEFRAEREVEKLINHFGGVQQWRTLSRELLAFGSKNLPGDVLENLSSSYEGVLALYRMMKAGGEPKLASRISSMMRDPKYWRDRDPAYIAKVTQGFENLYGR
ncbi:MAG: hypothetical protein ACLFU1_09115 [Alphaproteobacteria bacterium]